MLYLLFTTIIQKQPKLESVHFLIFKIIKRVVTSWLGIILAVVFVLLYCALSF